MSENEVIRKNLELHEEEAEEYEEEKTEIYNEKEQERIESALSDAMQHIETGDSEKRVLDLGCGTGNLLEKLIPRFDNVVGIDLSDDMLSVASSKFKDNDGLTLVRGKASDLPFQDDYFDMVSAYSLFHHLPEFAEPISEISRVLKSGGVLYIDHEPVNREDPLVQSYIKFCDILNGESREGLPPYNETEGREYCDYHIHHGDNCGIPTSDITDLCEEKGIEIVTTKEYLQNGMNIKNPLQTVLEPFADSEWLLMGKKST